MGERVAHEVDAGAVEEAVIAEVYPAAKLAWPHGGFRRAGSHDGRLPRAKQRPQQEQDGEKSGGEPLEVDRRRREVGLDLHVREAAPDGAGEAVPGLRLAVVALRSPAMTLVEPAVLVGPPLAPSPGAQERRVVVADHDGLVHAPLGEAERGEVAAFAIDGAGVEEAAVLHRPGRPQDLAARALQDVVARVVAKAAQRHGAADRLGLGRDHRRDLAPLEPAVDLGVGVAGVRRHVRIGAPVVSAAASMRASTTCPSLTSPVVTSTSRTTPKASSTTACCL